MMKLAGAFMIMGATSIWGIVEASRTKNQIKNIRYLQRIISLIQSEIQYSRTFLGEIFCNIGQGVKEPYKKWLLEMSERLNEFSGECFADIWKESIQKNLKILELPKWERETLESLGEQLGYADIQVQMKLLDYYQEHLERTMKEMYEQVQTKVRLYHCLGVVSGIFVTVLLI